MNEPLIDTNQGPDAGLLNALAEAEADRDRARSIAVALEQENAELERAKGGLTAATEALAAENNRLRTEAHAAHSVIEQAGLLQEALDGIGAGETLRRILNGATFDEVRNG